MDTKKLQAVLVGASLIAGGLVGAVVHSSTVEPVMVEKLVKVEVPVEKIVTNEVKVEVPGPTVTVEKVVTVEDNTFKALACDRLQYEILSECVQEVKAEDAALKLAIDKIKADFAEELEDANLVEDERDAKIVKIYSAYEDLEVSDSDYDNNEYTFVVKVKVADEEAETKIYANFTVDVEDSEAKIVDVELA